MGHATRPRGRASTVAVSAPAGRHCQRRRPSLRGPVPAGVHHRRRQVAGWLSHQAVLAPVRWCSAGCGCLVHGAADARRSVDRCGEHAGQTRCGRLLENRYRGTPLGHGFESHALRLTCRVAVLTCGKVVLGSLLDHARWGSVRLALSGQISVFAGQNVGRIHGPFTLLGSTVLAVRRELCPDRWSAVRPGGTHRMVLSRWQPRRHLAPYYRGCRVDVRLRPGCPVR